MRLLNIDDIHTCLFKHTGNFCQPFYPACSTPEIKHIGLILFRTSALTTLFLKLSLKKHEGVEGSQLPRITWGWREKGEVS